VRISPAGNMEPVQSSVVGLPAAMPDLDGELQPLFRFGPWQNIQTAPGSRYYSLCAASSGRRPRIRGIVTGRYTHSPPWLGAEARPLVQSCSGPGPPEAILGCASVSFFETDQKLTNGSPVPDNSSRYDPPSRRALGWPPVRALCLATAAPERGLQPGRWFDNRPEVRPSATVQGPRDVQARRALGHRSQPIRRGPVRSLADTDLIRARHPRPVSPLASTRPTFEATAGRSGRFICA